MDLSRSIWVDQTDLRPRRHLECDIETDTCIIGGGITGVSAAYYLAKAGRPCVLVEAKHIGYGASGRSSGIISQEAEMDIMSPENMRVMKEYLALNKEAANLVENCVKNEGIECDFKWSEEWGVALKHHQAQTLKEIFETRNSLGLAANYYKKDDAQKLFPFGVFAAISSKSATIGPWCFVKNLAQAAEQHGAKIYEQTRVTSLTQYKDRVLIKTNRGQIQARHILLALEAYHTDIAWPSSLKTFYKKIIPITIFAIASDPIPEITLKSIGWADKKIIWTPYALFNDIRLTADNRIVIGGEDIEFRASPLNTDHHLKHYQRTEATLRNLYPQLEKIPITHRWQGTIAFSVDGFPFIGPINKNIFVSCGYGGQGLAWGHLGGYLFFQYILGEDISRAAFLNPHRNLYDPIISIPPLLLKIFLKLPYALRALILHFTMAFLNFSDRLDRKSKK